MAFFAAALILAALAGCNANGEDKTSSTSQSSETVSSENVSSKDVSSEDVSSEDISSETASSEVEVKAPVSKAEAVSSKAPSPVTSPVLLPSFRVRVVDADKKPLKNAIVYIESTGDDLWSGDRITDNLGEFRLGNIPEEKLKSGKYKLRVNCPVDGIDEELTISITTDKVKEDYVITLNSKIKPVDSNTDKGLKLTVRNSSGSVVRNIKVNLQQLNVIPQTNGMSEDHSIGASFAPAGFTDDNGVVYFPNAKGEYRVTYSWKTGSHRLEESVVLNKTGITEKTLDFDETLLYP